MSRAAYNYQFFFKTIKIFVFFACIFGIWFLSFDSAKAANVNFTLQAWVRPEVSAATKAILAKDAEMRLVADGNSKLSCQIHNGTAWQTAAVSSAALSLNLWQYVSCAYDGSNLKVYINGQEAGSQAMTENVQNTANFLNTGKDSGGTYGYFNGFIDSVKIYPYARTAAQIKADYMARGTAKGVSASMGKALNEGGWMTQDLVGYWKMDEASWNGTAGEVIDSSGTGNNGVAVGATGIPTTGTGKFGNGGVFDGVDDYVSVADNNSLDITNAITVSAWVKADVVFSSRLGEGYTVKYEANELPENATPVWSKQGSEAATVSGGILTIVDTSTTSIRDYYRFWAMNRTTGSTILTRVKVNSTGTCGLGFYVTDNTSWAFVCFDNNSTDLNNLEFISYPVDNTIFHSYRITFKNGLMKIFLDENPTPIINRSILRTSGNNVLQFGSSAYLSSVSTSDWDYLYYSLDGAYEPSDEQYLIHNIASKGEDAYAFEIRSGMLYGFINSGSISTTIDTNWHYVTQTYDGSSHKLYVDGVLKSSRSLTGAIATNSSNLAFGNYLDGSIDSVRIYNRALSAKEVRDLYNFAPGPVGWWKMDEKVSGNAKTLNDSSGYGNTGTTYYGANATGMDCMVPGKIGGGCSFDGVDDYVNAGNGASLNITGAITIEAWVYWTAETNTLQFIVRKFNSGDGNDRIYWYVEKSNGLLHAGTYTGAVFQEVSTTISANTWNHIVWVYNKDDGSNQMKLYVNSIIKSQNTYTRQIPTTTGSWTLGGSSGNQFNGSIDEVRIYNYARTPSQIAEDYAGGAGRKQPVGHWKFDEGYGITANNSGIGGSSLNGAMTNFAAPATADSGWTNSGKFGKALKFDGTDDMATITNSTVIDLNDNLNAGFTIMGWVNADTAGEGSGGQIFWKGANNYLRVDTLSAGRLDIEGKLDLATTDANLNLSSTIATGAWNHIAMSYDGAAKITLWLNGVNKGSNTGSGATTAESNNLLIGGTTTDNFDGAIDDFKIYSYELTEDEIREEYNSGVTTKLGSTGTTSAGAPDDSANRTYCIPGDTSTCNPPVAYWNFDEGTGATVNDITGNNNTGAWNGTGSRWTIGKIGKGGSFNGSNDYIDAGNGASLNITGAMTVELWFNNKQLSASSGLKGVVGKMRWASSSDNQGWLLRFSNQQLVFISQHNLYEQVNFLSSFSANTWYHVAIVYNGTNLTKYVNGNQDSISAITQWLPTTNSLLIGSSYGTAENFNGTIDDVRIYNYARTPAQVAWDYNRGKPVAEWKFDECSGATANDASGNGNNGTITIGATGAQNGLGSCAGVDTSKAWYNGRAGKINSAMSFDGVDDYAGVADSSVLDLTSFTLSSWVKINQYKLSGIVSKSSPGPDTSGKNINYAIGIDASGYGGVAFEETDGTDHALSSVSILPLDTWVHFTGSYDYASGVFKVYINGKLDAQKTEGTFQPELNAQMVGIANGILDGVPSAGYYFNGLIDDVKIFNYALTPAQVKIEYNGGAVSFK